MKNQSLISIFILIILFGFEPKIFAQRADIIHEECTNDLILIQVDSLKKLYAKDNFIAVKESSMLMESEYEIPAIMPLTAGTWYQFVFIGEITSRLYEVRLFDWDERQVVYQKKMWGDVDGNIISFSYIPKFSEFHMMRSVQVNKKHKKVCGYVILFKKIIKL